MTAAIDALNERPHRRRNLLTGEWVLVSPQRMQRPWDGERSEPPVTKRPAYDPHCYLCPGNTRANGVTNPDYDGVFVFDNDFPALLPGVADPAFHDDLFEAEAEPGRCRVICYSPRHDLSTGALDHKALAALVDAWCEETRRLGSEDDINHVQIFENRGAMMGCSNPHPHGQVWATASLPTLVRREQERQADHLVETGRPLLLDVLERERALGDRLVFENRDFSVIVPFWATWPFETLILPRRHRPGLLHLDVSERASLADTYGRLARTWDRVFDCEFPFSAGVHQAPMDGAEHPEWQLHLHGFPPLLRSATVRKYMVGYELLASPQRDLTPEAAAERLRAVLAPASD